VSHKSSLLTVIAIIIFSSLLPAFSPTGAHREASQQHSESQSAALIPKNEQTVAEAAIEQFIIRGRPLVQTASHVWAYHAGTPILVSQETWENATTSGINIPREQEEAFKDYVERNQTAGRWGRPPSLTVPSEFAPPCLTCLAEYWNQLLSSHPGATGVLTVSRPGFSADGQTAWIQIHINTGSGTSPRMTWWVHLHQAATGWSVLEAKTLTADDRHFAQLPRIIPRQGGLLWELGAAGSYEERISNRRLVER